MKQTLVAACCLLAFTPAYAGFFGSDALDEVQDTVIVPKTGLTLKKAFKEYKFCSSVDWETKKTDDDEEVAIVSCKLKHVQAFPTIAKFIIKEYWANDPDIKKAMKTFDDWTGIKSMTYRAAFLPPNKKSGAPTRFTGDWTDIEWNDGTRHHSKNRYNSNQLIAFLKTDSPLWFHHKLFDPDRIDYKNWNMLSVQRILWLYDEANSK